MSGAFLFSTSSSEPLSTSVIEIKLVLVTDSETAEMQGLSESVDELLAELNEKKLFADEDNLESVYFKNKGIFLKLVAKSTLVGTGAVKKLTDDICEMKRMFILKKYRGQGWRKRIADQLFAFARKNGYKKMRLEVWRHPMVHQAVSFYKNL
jgi:putative acetyltransferase